MDDEIRAIVEAERLAAELANIDPAVREVWLFGSVASGRPGREEFDIDLAIAGGDALTLFAQLPETEFEVDIVELENVSARFREMVKRTGEQLYGTDG
jgi:predicted nucleotidyltransferase